MDLHHKSVIKAHASHLCQHLSAEQIRFIRRAGAGHRLGKKDFCLGLRQVRGARAGMAVIGGSCPEALEIGPAGAVRRQIAGPA